MFLILTSLLSIGLFIFTYPKSHMISSKQELFYFVASLIINRKKVTRFNKVLVCFPIQPSLIFMAGLRPT